jgi:hypothetical protein
MGAEFLALIPVVLGLIAAFINAQKTRKANRNDIGKVESAELGAAMDRADAAPRVQPAKLKGRTVYVRRQPPV